MTFFPDSTTLEKFMNNDWRTLVYGEPAETWDEKMYSLIRESWRKIISFLESRGREFLNHSALYGAIFIGSVIVLGTLKYVSHVGTIGLRKKPPQPEEREKIAAEESRIVSDGGNGKIVKSAEKPRSTCRSGLENATSARDNDQLDGVPESCISSDTTIVASERNENFFLKNLIDSFEPGDDGVDNNAASIEKKSEQTEDYATSELQESTRRKVDSKNCKQFYVLTPWMGDDAVNPGDAEEPCGPAKNFASPLAMNENRKKLEPAMHKNFISVTGEINKNAFVASKLAKPGLPEAASLDAITDEAESTGQTMRETTNSTLVEARETSSVCYADQVLSSTNDRENNIFSRKSWNSEAKKQLESSTVSPACEIRRNNAEERDFNNVPPRLPELDLSPISRNPENIEKSIDLAASEIRPDSRNRYRSLSHDQRTASSAEYLDTRRGSSVSPLARNKNKQRTTKQIQSKIPTLNPLAFRGMHNRETDGSLEETANRIRSVLLARLKEVWEQHSRDSNSSPNRSMNSNFENSVFSTPEGMSRIPLPRRSPRHSNTNYVTPASRPISHRDNVTDQSGASYSGTSNCLFSGNAADVPLHSTPKTSPSSRDSNHHRRL